MPEWKQRDAPPIDDAWGKAMAQKGVNPWIVRALWARNVRSVDEGVGKYPLEHFRSLRGLTDILPVLDRAIDAQEHIIVVADYDCDGATACTVAVEGLRGLGANIDFVVPNRFIHGYGLTPSVVDSVVDRKPRWLLTVDNGIASNAGIDHAHSLGIGVLVTDHHLPGPVLPHADAIVNPNQPDCPFPSKNLAGCGVMYYVLAALRDLRLSRGDAKAKALNLNTLLDVVALGTVADVVRLDANNRWLVRRGLEFIRNEQVRPGIRALFEVAGRSLRYARSQDFGFAVGPRINAAGRLTDMTVGIRCLLSQDVHEARDWAEELHELNRSRKEIELTMRNQAWEDIDLSGQEGQFTRVVFQPDFHEGVIGIVAGRIKESCHTPTFVFAPAHNDPGFIKGSGRSIDGVHLRDVLDLVHKRGNGLITKFGGHAMAAGMTMPLDRLDEFKVLFEEAVREWCQQQQLTKVLLTDGDLPAHAIELELAYALGFEVWGQGFEEPVWTGTFTVQEARLVGKDRNHVQMVLEQDGHTFKAMQFFSTDFPDAGSQLNLAFAVDWNEFRGEHNITLRVVDRR